MRNNKLKFIMAALLIGGTAFSLANRKPVSLEREQALEPDVVTYDEDAIYERDDLLFAAIPVPSSRESKCCGDGCA